MDKVEALRSSPLLRALSDAELDSLMGIVNERSLAAGQTLITAGEKGVAMYIILEGKVQVSRGGTASIVQSWKPATPSAHPSHTPFERIFHASTGCFRFSTATLTMSP